MGRRFAAFALLLAAAPLRAGAPAIDWDGGNAREFSSRLAPAVSAVSAAVAAPVPPGRRELPETGDRDFRFISGPGGQTLLEPAPRLNPDGTRAKYQPNMSVGVVRGGKVIEWYPVQYGYYLDPQGRLVKGLHVSFDRYKGTSVSLPWGDPPLPRVDGGAFVPDGIGVAPYGVGENPVFHPYVGKVPLKRAPRDRKLQY